MFNDVVVVIVVDEVVIREVVVGVVHVVDQFYVVMYVWCCC